jgi:23S rRNA (uracil1939-C5)-methyltransferase
MLSKNDLIPLIISDITTEASGVGRTEEGFAVFVPGAAVGDRLTVRIVKVLKSYAFGIIEEILEPSPDRIPSDCPVSRGCGGCSLRHISYEAECRLKERWVTENFRRIGGIQAEVLPILPSPRRQGYRNKAQYPVRADADGKLVMGFFAKRSHRVVPCVSCRLQPDLFEEILRFLEGFCRRHGVAPYDEARRTGLLRHIYLRMGEATGQVMVCLVVNGGGLPCEEELARELPARFPSVASLILNRNRENTNVILGKDCRTLWGKGYIEDILCGVRVRISPLSFYQVNREGAENLYRTAAEFAELGGDETLLDLYCGAGTIGLSMASRVRRLIGVEAVASAVENARENARENKIENARFLCGDAAEAAGTLLREGVSPDIVVMDPPRKGCDASLLDTAASMAPQKIVMISCNSATAARDCAILEQKGYRVKKLRAVDMFPRTAHVECVALLLREV